MLRRLCDNWVYGSFLAAILLFLLTPFLSRDWPEFLTLIWLQLPVYMLHQYEEHDGDRFRSFVNATIGNGRAVLSRLDVFIINVVGVWGLDALSFWLAGSVHLGLGLVAVYLSLVNSIGHCIQAILLRRYNPGLITSIILFLPLGLTTMYMLTDQGIASLSDHIVGLVSALAVHAVIIAIVIRRKLALHR